MGATDANSSRPWDVHRYRQVDSTNRVATELARHGAPDGVVVLADHQTAGRGRHGRRWEAPPGSSLLVSVLLRTVVEREILQLTTVAAGVAACDACLEATGIAAQLKWPNDVVVDERKLAGMLTELVPPDAVVVGLGLNANWDRPLPEGAVALNHLTGATVDREALLWAFLPWLRAHTRALARAEPRHELLDRYRGLCSTLGRTVVVRLGDREVAGRAVSIGADGHLMIEQDGRTYDVSAGALDYREEQ